MDLENQIQPSLWLAIHDAYDARNYTHAIKDAFVHLTNSIREVSGLDGDGVQLVGRAFGGDSPNLMLNKLQTESEKDEQKGIAEVLRGLYTGIRNPRNHDSIVDTKDTADAIVVFLDYLLRLIERATEHYTLERYFERVFDSAFVRTDKYADLLALEIPVKKRADTLIEIYRRREEGDEECLSLLASKILALLSPSELTNYLKVVSEDFKFLKGEDAVRTALRLIEPTHWPKIADVARLRIEGMLMASVKEGHCWDGLSSNDGLLGTWSRDYLPYFVSLDECLDMMVRKLAYGNDAESAYVSEFFLPQVAVLISKRHNNMFVHALSRDILEGKCIHRNALIKSIATFPLTLQRDLAKKLVSETNPESPAVRLADGEPFLSAEDIPF